MERESNGDTNCNWCVWYSHQRIGKERGGLRKLEDEWRPSKRQH